MMKITFLSHFFILSTLTTMAVICLSCVTSRSSFHSYQSYHVVQPGAEQGEELSKENTGSTDLSAAESEVLFQVREALKNIQIPGIYITVTPSGKNSKKNVTSKGNSAGSCSSGKPIKIFVSSCSSTVSDGLTLGGSKQIESGTPNVSDDVCTLPFARGPCMAYFPSWYFDVFSGECRTFNFGGCEGNGNRFGSMSDCERRCRGRLPEKVSQPQSTPPIKSTQATCGGLVNLHPNQPEDLTYSNIDGRSCLWILWAPHSTTTYITFDPLNFTHEVTPRLSLHKNFEGLKDSGLGTQMIEARRPGERVYSTSEVNILASTVGNSLGIRSGFQAKIETKRIRGDHFKNDLQQDIPLHSVRLHYLPAPTPTINTISREGGEASNQTLLEFFLLSPTPGSSVHLVVNSVQLRPTGPDDFLSVFTFSRATHQIRQWKRFTSAPQPLGPKLDLLRVSEDELILMYLRTSPRRAYNDQIPLRNTFTITISTVPTPTGVPQHRPKSARKTQ